MLKSSYNLEYILTQRLNQDCLEHFFGCIRQMHGTYDHPNPVEFKFRLKTLLLGRDIKVVSEKVNTGTKESELSEESVSAAKESKINDREVALELCLTSQLFRNIDFELIEDELDDGAEISVPIEVVEKSAENVIEEEALRYIGGYIVRKFSMKYPYLGSKANSTELQTSTWIAAVNKGDLYVPSEEFFSKLLVLREVFNAIHGEALLGGKRCVQTLYSELKRSGVSVPDEVIIFFAKISIYFRMRHFNNNIKSI